MDNGKLLMKIRTASVADAPAIHALFTQLERETDHIGIGETDSLQLGAYISQLMSLPQQEMWLAISDENDIEHENYTEEEISTVNEMKATNTILGFAMIMPNYLSCDDACAALMLGLKQTYVGRGLGLQLLRHVESWATGVGLSRLELTVKEVNQTALRFYLQADFKVKAPNAGVSLDHQRSNVLYMVKDLK